MSTWYWLENGERKGPVNRDELGGMFRSGELSSDTCVWSVGLADWTPARGVDGLVPADACPPPVPARLKPLASPAYVASGNDSASKRVRAARAWSRWLARVVDYVLFALLLWWTVTGLRPEMSERELDTFGQALNYLVVPMWIVPECMLLWCWGSTPGKFLMNIRVKSVDGRRVSLVTAIKRSLSVWIAGMGLGVFMPLTAAAQGFAYFRLTRDGIAPWDTGNRRIANLQFFQGERNEVEHRPLGLIRIGILLSSFVAIGIILWESA